MIKLVAVTALVGAGGCLVDPEARDLAELSQLTAVVEVDVGVPDDQGSNNFLRGGMDLTLEDPTAGCFAVHGSARLSLDGVEAGYVVRGGSYSDTVHGSVESGCESPSFLVHERPAPRDVSTIRLADDSATLTIAIEDFLVNPAMVVPGPVRSSQPAVIKVFDSRPLARARVWWRADVVTGTNQWTVNEADVSTPGEIRFAVPAYTGKGTLQIQVAITQHQLECRGFAACDVTVHGGASVPLTITN